MRHLLRAGILSLGCALLTSCAEGGEPLDPAIQTYSPLEEERFAPRVIDDPGPQVVAEDAARVKPILEGFERNADEILSRTDLAQRIGLIESAYLISGRYMDLLVIYQRHVAKHGAQSAAMPRLIWSWLRLGQEKWAGELAEAYVKARPDDATAWFLQGAYWVRYAQDSAEIARDVIMAWKRTLALDPLFVGFDEIDAAALRGEIEKMNASIKMSEEEAAKRAAAHIAKLNALPAPAAPADAPPLEPPTSEAPPAEVAPPVEAAPVIAQPQPQLQPQPQQAEPLTLTLARAQLAADAGSRDQAVAYLREARQRHMPGPDLVAAAQGAGLSAADALAYVEIAWRLEQDRPAVARLAREIAGRPGLSASQQWSLALFALRQMEDRALAAQIAGRLKREHPADAARLGADALLSPQ